MVRVVVRVVLRVVLVGWTRAVEVGRLDKEESGACGNLVWCEKRRGRSLCGATRARFVEVPETAPAWSRQRLLIGVAFGSTDDCEAGGATVRVEARGPASTATASARRLRPGHGDEVLYEASVGVGGPGEYQATAVLDADGCAVTTRCHVRSTELAVKKLATTRFAVGAANATSGGGFQGAWVTDGGRRAWMDPRRKRNTEFDAAVLKGRWIHFVGMSMSRLMLHDVARVLSERWGPPTGLDLTLRRCNERAHPDVVLEKLDLRLTQLCHDLGINVGSRPNLTKHLESLGGSGLPDAIVFNKGIHAAELIHSTRALYPYAASIRVHLDAFRASGALVYWRKTLPTHFHRPRPHRAWGCRHWERIDCLNAVADAVLSQLSSHRIAVLDYWDLALARPDCTNDNRHYTHANCGDTIARLFLHRLVTDLQARG